MRTVFALVVLGLVAIPAYAQSETNPVPTPSLRALSNAPIDQPTIAILKQEHDDRDALNTATWVYLAAASADWSATAVCAQVVCFDEHSMTGLFLYGVERPTIAIPLGLAVDAVWIVGIRELVAPDHPKLARALLYGSSAVRLVFTVSKINDLRAHAVRVPR